MAVSALQFVLLFILFASLKLWETSCGASGETGEKNDESIVTISETIGIPGIKSACFAFLCYSGLELSVGLWTASYLVERKNLLSTTAATWVSTYYACITAGRFASGFLAAKFSGRALIRGGCILTLAGVAFLFSRPHFAPLIGLALMGVGNAPFYPTTIHEIPVRFGARCSQSAVGLQIACAYVGSAFLPPVAGLLAKRFSLAIYPWFLLFLSVLMFFFSERIIRIIKRRG